MALTSAARIWYKCANMGLIARSGIVAGIGV